ncbi:MAG: M28 family peptidase [Kiritimatiellae bacterium]|nr:M28 family peptidase [Kiritimatiellia bacterium]
MKPAPRQPAETLAACAAALTLAASLAIVGCRPVSRSSRPAPPNRAAVIAPAGLGSNALRRVERLLALGPRDAGTEGAARAARWIADELRTIGLETRLDSFGDATPAGTQTFYNVLATLPGSSDEWVVLLSHYDTKSGVATNFVGANDSGSSTGLLLELAAAIRRGSPRKHNVLLAFLDGEECLHSYGPADGLHGSRRLADQLRRRHEKVRAVILLDMVGDHDLIFTLPRNGTAALKLLLLDAAAAQGCRQRVRLLTCDILDDHQPFLDAGFPAVNLIDFEYGSRPGDNDYWHTAADSLDKLTPDALRQAGAIVLEMLNRLKER